MKGNVGREGHQCPGWTPNLVCMQLWPGIGGSREGGLGAGGPSQNFGHQVSGLVEGADVRCRGMNRGLPEVQQGREALSHDQSGSALLARSERASLIMLSKDPRAFGMRLEGQVRRTCASFGRAKQDLRRVVSSWES